MSKMGSDRQPTTGTCFALAPLIPTCLLPTKARVTLAGTSQTFSVCYSTGAPASFTPPPKKPKSVGPTTTRDNHTRTNEIFLSLFFCAKPVSPARAHRGVSRDIVKEKTGLPTFGQLPLSRFRGLSSFTFATINEPQLSPLNFRIYKESLLNYDFYLQPCLIEVGARAYGWGLATRN